MATVELQMRNPPVVRETLDGVKDSSEQETVQKTHQSGKKIQSQLLIRTLR